MTKPYVWQEGDRTHVVNGPYTGAVGRVAFIDLPRRRALIDFGEGRRGGLRWVGLESMYPPSGKSLWDPPNPPRKGQVV
jgi:hypothetical protein